VPKIASNDLTAEQVRDLFDYNPETGTLTWIKCASNKSRFVNCIAGTKDSKGYLIVKIRRKLYKQHRIAWLWMTGRWPEAEIDHKDRDPANNRWDNLREATPRQNCINQKSTGRSGLRGAAWTGQYQKWFSTIRVDGKRIFLGYFETAESAHAAYVEASRKYHGEFARWS
jgi:hypothetical protein